MHNSTFIVVIKSVYFLFKSISTAGNQSNIDHHQNLKFQVFKNQTEIELPIGNISGWHTNPITTKLVLTERGTMNNQCKNVLHQSFSVFGECVFRAICCFDINCMLDKIRILHINRDYF